MLDFSISQPQLCCLDVHQKQFGARSIRCPGLVLVTMCWTGESSEREQEINLSKWTSTVQ